MSNDFSFCILQDIARDLSGDVVSFPTFLDITFQVRTALKNPNLTIEQLGRLLSAEPLMSSKIIRLANSVAMNSSGRTIVDVSSAIARVGMDAVRTVSFAVAMEQLLNSKKMAPFQALSRRLWEHTVYVAALSRVLARRVGRVNPDEAMFAGLVHDIGVFYLLSRVTNFPELVTDPLALQQLLVQWHDSIGHALLAAMGLPEEVLRVVQEHEQERCRKKNEYVAVHVHSKDQEGGSKIREAFSVVGNNTIEQRLRIICFFHRIISGVRTSTGFRSLEGRVRKDKTDPGRKGH